MSTQVVIPETASSHRQRTNSHIGLRTSCWVAALALGAAQTWATRLTMNTDGISYADIGDAYWRGDWQNAINAYWSPLYSWVLGLFLKVFRASPHWEFPVVHLANFAIYVATLAAFEFFLLAFIKTRKPRSEQFSPALMSIPDAACWLLGYTLFLSSSLILIGLRLVSPDLMVSGFIYLALGLILRIRFQPCHRGTFIALGAVLGFGYLAKAVLLPLGVVMLATAVLAGGINNRSLQRAAPAFAMFLLVTVPFIAAISKMKGRLTFGDSGQLTYAASINGVDPWYPGDGGQLLGTGATYVEDIDGPSRIREALRHPALRIFHQPPAYWFGRPISGTYPFWYDPSYWQDGVRGHFELKGQIQAVAQSFLTYFSLIKTVYANVLTPLLIFFLISQAPTKVVALALRHWPVILPCVAGLLLYSLFHTEHRYVAGFLPALWLIAADSLRFYQSKNLQRFIVVTVGAVALTTIFFIGQSIALDFVTGTRPDYPEAAAQLENSGVKAGDNIATISDFPFREGGAFVARLARLRIVAQVNRPDRFWAAPVPVQAGVLDAFQKAGCVGVLGWRIPKATKGWHRLGITNYYFFPLNP